MSAGERSNLELMRDIWSLFNKRDRKSLYLVILVVTISTIIGSISTIFLAKILDTLNQSTNIRSTYEIIALLVAFVLTKSSGRFVSDIRWLFFNPVAYRITYRLGLAFSSRIALTKLPTAENSAKETGRLSSLITKGQAGLMSILYQIFIAVLPSVVEIVFVGTALGMMLGWHAPFVISLSSILYCSFLNFGRKREISMLKECNKADNEVAGSIAELSSNSHIVQQYSASSFFQLRAQEKINESLVIHKDFFKFKVLRGLYISIGLTLSYGAAALYSYIFLYSGKGSAGTIFLAVSFVDRLIVPLNMASASLTSFQNGMASLRDCEAEGFFQQYNSKPNSEPTSTRQSLSLEIGRERCINLRPGETIVIRGESGSGKSSLLARIYDMENLDKINISDDHRNNKFSCFKQAEHICYISSECLIVSGSISENIHLGRTDYNAEMVRDVFCSIWDCGLEEFSEILERNIDEISSGEKQRVALIRAILRNPRILIMDESYNAIDVERSKKIWRSIKKFLPNTIYFVVSHREDSFITPDYQILVKNGRIIL